MQKNLPQRHAITFGRHTEVHWTFPVVANATQLQKHIKACEKDGSTIVKISYFGNKDKIAELIRGAKQYPTVVVGNSVRGKGIDEVSVCILTLRSVDHIAPVLLDNVVVGYELTHTSYRQLYIPSIMSVGGRGSTTFGTEARSVYTKIARVLRIQHYMTSDVYRFWNYMTSIGKNYAPFNKARDVFYKKHTIERYPSATGIEARFSNRAHLLIGFEAMHQSGKGAVRVERIRSSMQSEAWSYGPKFSRATLVTYPRDHIKKMYISGTSSVNTRGESILMHVYDENILYTVACIEHLLKKGGMDLTRIVSAIVYGVNTDVLKTFQQLYTKNGWTFPYNPVVTSICRSNLVFEMECISSRAL